MEMDCFIRLIRDEVAGNMVRTLFLTGSVPPNSCRVEHRPGPCKSRLRAQAKPRRARCSPARALRSSKRERLPKAGLVLITSPGAEVSASVTKSRGYALRRVLWPRFASGLELGLRPHYAWTRSRGLRPGR